MSAKDKNLIYKARKATRRILEGLRLAKLERDPLFREAMIKGCASDANSLAIALGHKPKAKAKPKAKK